MNPIWSIFSSMDQLVRFCIWLQTLAILSFGVFTLFLLIHRRYRREQSAQLKEVYGGIIVMELVRLAENPEHTPADDEMPEGLQKTRSRFEQIVLQETLLEHMRSVTGQERERIEILYRLCGGEARDVKLCFSMFWWRRLAAVAHLTLLKSTATAPVLHQLTTDRNGLVAGAALLALSRIDHPLSHPSKWPAFPPTLLRRRSVFCEILSNVGQIHGVGYLVRWLRIAKNDEFKSVCLQVILSLKSAESVPQLCDTILYTPKMSADLTCEILGALRRIGDPLANEAAWFSFSHRHPRVRVRAAELLLDLQMDREAEILARLDGDPAAEVRRVAVDYRRRIGDPAAETGRAA